MGIRFTCDNPHCRKEIRATDAMGGRKDRCPRCGQVVVVPLGEVGGELGERDAAYIRAVTWVHERMLTLTARAEAMERLGPAPCPRCFRRLGPGLETCPFCGLDLVSSSEGTQLTAPSLAGSLRRQLAAVGDSLRRVPEAMGWAAVLTGLVVLASGLVPAPAGVVLLMYVLAVWTLAWRLLEAVRSATDPRAPRGGGALRWLLTPVKLAILAGVYVLPLVTIPLFPAGVVLQSRGRLGGLNVLNVARSLRDLREEYAALWMVLAVVGVAGWGLATGVAAFFADAAAPLRTGGAAQTTVRVVAALLVVLIILVALWTAAEAIGRFGRVWVNYVRAERG